jgi:hypothetical protein
MMCADMTMARFFSSALLVVGVNSFRDSGFYENVLSIFSVFLGITFFHLSFYQQHRKDREIARYLASVGVILAGGYLTRYLHELAETFHRGPYFSKMSELVGFTAKEDATTWHLLFGGLQAVHFLSIGVGMNVVDFLVDGRPVFDPKIFDMAHRWGTRSGPLAAIQIFYFLAFSVHNVILLRMVAPNFPIDWISVYYDAFLRIAVFGGPVLYLFFLAFGEILPRSVEILAPVMRLLEYREKPTAFSRWRRTVQGLELVFRAEEDLRASGSISDESDSRQITEAVERYWYARGSSLSENESARNISDPRHDEAIRNVDRLIDLVNTLDFSSRLCVYLNQDLWNDALKLFGVVTYDCAICLERDRKMDPTKSIVLRCRHVFCRSCLRGAAGFKEGDTLLSGSKTPFRFFNCPLCRKKHCNFEVGLHLAEKDILEILAESDKRDATP